MVNRYLIIAILCVTGVLSLCSNSYSQIYDDFDFIVKNNPIDKEKEKKSINITPKETSEIKIAFLGLIKVYQKFISSQDTSVCNFTLSCSRFGMTAIDNFGLLHGILITSDRLQRCHGLGRKYYQIDNETGSAVDYPISYYYLGKAKRKTSITK